VSPKDSKTPIPDTLADDLLPSGRSVTEVSSGEIGNSASHWDNASPGKTLPNRVVPCHCGAAAKFGYKNSNDEPPWSWYCATHRRAQFYADACLETSEQITHPEHEPPNDSRTAAPPLALSFDTPFVHQCHCGKWGSFGYGVSLRHGKPGTWYCAEHRPAQAESTAASGSDHPPSNLLAKVGRPDKTTPGAQAPGGLAACKADRRTGQTKIERGPTQPEMAEPFQGACPCGAPGLYVILIEGRWRWSCERHRVTHRPPGDAR
jgi:hypothetical protein